LSIDTTKSTQILGSYIGKYNRIYKRKKTAKLAEQYDIKNIMNRLEGYKKYRQTIRKERKLKEQKQVKKMVTKVKKTINKVLYSDNNSNNNTNNFKFKPIYNPYLQIYEKLSSAVDPKLLEKYRTSNVYSLHEFRHLTLPRSNNDITAGQAWNGLKKSWIGYKITHDNKNRFNNTENAKIYAATIQKWSYLLEINKIPSFPDIGISAEGFKHADILKLYFNGYEKEEVS
jgi:hypothetical protein